MKQKKQKLFFAAGAIFAALLAFSCSNLFNGGSQKRASEQKSGTAYVTINLGSSERTALPSGIKTESLKNFELLVGSKKIASWKSSSEMDGAKVEVSALGKQKFTLLAKYGDTDTTLSGTTELDVKAGANDISFDLYITSYDKTGQGSLSVTFALTNSSGANKIKVALYDAEGLLVKGSGKDSTTLASFKYEMKDVASGNYTVRAAYLDADGTEVAVWEEAVIVAKSLTSTSEITIPSLNSIYKITYEIPKTVDGEAIDANSVVWPATYPKSYTVEQTVALPKITLEGKKFNGWATKQDGEEVITGWGFGEKSGALTLYAVFASKEVVTKPPLDRLDKILKVGNSWETKDLIALTSAFTKEKYDAIGYDDDGNQIEIQRKLNKADKITLCVKADNLGNYSSLGIPGEYSWGQWSLERVDGVLKHVFTEEDLANLKQWGEKDKNGGETGGIKLNQTDISGNIQIWFDLEMAVPSPNDTYVTTVTYPGALSAGQNIAITYTVNGAKNYGYNYALAPFDDYENEYGVYFSDEEGIENGSKFTVVFTANKAWDAGTATFKIGFKNAFKNETSNITVSDVSYEVLQSLGEALTSETMQSGAWTVDAEKGEFGQNVDFTLGAKIGDLIRIYITPVGSGCGDCQYIGILSSIDSNWWLDGVFPEEEVLTAGKTYSIDYRVTQAFAECTIYFNFGKASNPHSTSGNVSFEAYVVNLSQSSTIEPVVYDYPAQKSDSYTVPSGSPGFNISDLKMGWNLGNTLDAHNDGNPQEGLWCADLPNNGGKPRANQAIMTGVKAAGFDTVRIPVTWGSMIGKEENGYKINEGYLERVAEVVGYAHTAGLKAIINIHHDGADSAYWLDIKNSAKTSTVTSAGPAEEKVTKELYYVWRQIAEYFVEHAKGSESYLMFETMNEIHDGGWGYGGNKTDGGIQYAILNRWNQACVQAIRWAGAGHYIICPGYVTNIDLTVGNGGTTATFVPPTDKCNRIVLTVHEYSPNDFCLSATDTNWSVAEDTTAESWNADTNQYKYGSKLYLKREYERVANFVKDKKLAGAIIGECGAVDGGNRAKRKEYNVFLVTESVKQGLVPIIWDSGSGYGKAGGESSGLFDRASGKPFDYNVEMLREMAKAAGTTYSQTDSYKE